MYSEQKHLHELQNRRWSITKRHGDVEAWRGDMEAVRVHPKGIRRASVMEHLLGKITKRRKQQVAGWHRRCGIMPCEKKEKRRKKENKEAMEIWQKIESENTKVDKRRSKTWQKETPLMMSTWMSTSDGRLERDQCWDKPPRESDSTTMSLLFPRYHVFLYLFPPRSLPFFSPRFSQLGGALGKNTINKICPHHNNRNFTVC